MQLKSNISRNENVVPLLLFYIIQIKKIELFNKIEQRHEAFSKKKTKYLQSHERIIEEKPNF